VSEGGSVMSGGSGLKKCEFKDLPTGRPMNRPGVGFVVECRPKNRPIRTGTRVPLVGL
jgi:hypothetical protein